MGIQSSIIGVALLDLQVLSGATFDTVTLLVTGRALGYGFGSVAGGFLDAKCNTQLTIMLSQFIGAVVHVGIPLCRTLWLMIVLNLIAGISCGVVDNRELEPIPTTACYKPFLVANVFILKLWAKECPPFLQALHFCFGVGSLLASLIVEPFIKEDGSRELSGPSNATIPELQPDDIELFVPYYIIAAIGAFVGFLFLLMYVKFRETTDHPSRNTTAVIEQDKDGKKVEVTKIIKPRIRMLLIILTSLFLLVYIGFEKTVGVFIPAYGHHGPLGLSKKTGANISAVYWALFTSFRLVAVILSGVIGTFWILVMNIFNTVIATVTIVAVQTSEPVFWFSCAFMGIGLSSTWGSMFGFMESQFPLNGKIVSCFSFGACLGSSIFPAVMGYLMAIDNQIFVWFCLAFSLLIASFFLIIYLICKNYLSTTRRVTLRTQMSTISASKPKF